MNNIFHNVCGVIFLPASPRSLTPSLLPPSLPPLSLFPLPPSLYISPSLTLSLVLVTYLYLPFLPPCLHPCFPPSPPTSLIPSLALLLSLHVFPSPLFFWAISIICCTFFSRCQHFDTRKRRSRIGIQVYERCVRQGVPLYLYYYRRRVCVCKIGPIPARTLSFRHQTSRKFFSHSNFPIPYLWTAFCIPLSSVFYEKQ